MPDRADQRGARLRALLSGVPICRLGGQDQPRGDRNGDARDEGRSLKVSAPETARFPASLVLAGAGKMGGAMLRAWLDQGLDPRGVDVLDPCPNQEILALASERGVALNAPA